MAVEESGSGERPYENPRKWADPGREGDPFAENWEPDIMPKPGRPRRRPDWYYLASFATGSVLAIVLTTTHRYTGAGIGFGVVISLALMLRLVISGVRSKAVYLAGTAYVCVWLVIAGVRLVGVAGGPDREALRQGVCFTPAGTPATLTGKVTGQPCTSPHRAEVVGTVPANSPGQSLDASYPGVEVLGGRAPEACERVREAYVVDPLSVPAEVHLYWFLPTAGEWASNPTFTCYLATGQTTLIRSVYEGVDKLGQYQIEFLVPLQHYTHAVDNLNALPANTSLADLHEALRTVAATSSDLTLKLEATSWPNADRMATLVAALDKVSNLWTQASVAPDAAGARGAMARAEQDSTVTDATTAVRQTLGLPTAPAGQ
jgi:hypothetical protein